MTKKTNFINKEDAEKIKSILEKNGVIAFPTDTVWGMGCLPEKSIAVQKIYSIKERDAKKPLILLGKDIESLLPYVEKFHTNAEKIMQKYFPGAVTLVLSKSEKTPDYLTSGFDTVGIRIPDCPVFIEMLDKCTETGVLATTSANISDMGAVSTKEEVIKSIGDKIDFIVDNYGFLPKGLESTVVIVDNAGSLKIFRQGAIQISI
jgi:L-threonylcarbamoyladenylate synthase